MRLEALCTLDIAYLGPFGATGIDIGQGAASWRCLAESEGNQFCALSPG